jgi:hypothetical protein
MPISFFTGILQKIKKYTDYLYFHVMGEPLMHPDIAALLDVSYEYGFKINITTNGTLIKRLGPVIAKKTALRQINISLHCFEENDFGGPEDNYIDDVIAFVKNMQGEKGPIVCLRLWNLPEKGGLADNGRILQRIKQEFNCTTQLADCLKMNDGVTIADNVFLNCAARFDWPGFDKQDRGTVGFCHGLRDQLAILADGTVVPCCLDAQGGIALGNIGHQALSDILKGARAKALYDGFSKRTVVEELCRKCGYRARFDLIGKSR